MITCINDIIGTYAVDYDNNVLPYTKEITARFVAHTGTEVWVQSPSGDSSDCLIFGHIHGNIAWFTREFGGRMITIRSERKYDYHMQMWYWYNTVHAA